jgi:hypothetical protein
MPAEYVNNHLRLPHPQVASPLAVLRHDIRHDLRARVFRDHKSTFDLHHTEVVQHSVEDAGESEDPPHDGAASGEEVEEGFSANTQERLL